MSSTSEVDDQAEGAADDHADGKVHDIALGDEFLEFLQHSSPPSLCQRCSAPPSNAAAARADHSKSMPAGRTGKSHRFAARSRPSAPNVARMDLRAEAVIAFRAEHGSAGRSMIGVQGWVIVIIAIAYVTLLFAIASLGDRRAARRGAGRPRPYHLCAQPRHLLHLLDLLRLGRPRLRARPRIPRHLYRPGAGVRVRLPAAQPHHPAGQGREDHLDRRLPRRALRQELRRRARSPR